MCSQEKLRKRKRIWAFSLDWQENRLSTFRAVINGGTAGPSGMHVKTTDIYTYIKRPGDDYLIHIAYIDNELIIGKIFFYKQMFKGFKKNLDFFLKDLCPNITEGMTLEEYKELNIDMISKYHEINCE
jgi:hypothetical protein